MEPNLENHRVETKTMILKRKKPFEMLVFCQKIGHGSMILGDGDGWSCAFSFIGDTVGGKGDGLDAERGLKIRMDGGGFLDGA